MNRFYKIASAPLSPEKTYYTKQGLRLRFSHADGLMNFFTYADKANPDGPFMVAAFVYERASGAPSWQQVFNPEEFNREEVLSWFSEPSREALSVLSDEQLNGFLMYDVRADALVQFRPDPVVVGCYAFQIENPNEEPFGLIFPPRSVEPDEVSFSTWPPVSGSLKFF